MNKFLLSSTLLACALTAPCLLAQDRAITMNIVYPMGAFAQNGGPVINIKNTTLFSPNAVGNGVADDTAAFVAMMTYIKQQIQALNGGDPNKIIYIPSGTYKVSNTIFYSGADYNLFCRLRIIGQNRANTIIKLADNSPGFGAGVQKPVLAWTKMIETGKTGNVMWGNQLRNLTIDTGSGNPGAVGVDFLGANGCSIDNLTVRSGDGQGYAGLRFPFWSVQGHFCDITVSGFDYGIRAGDDVRETNPVLEYVTLSGQRIAGIQVGRSAACLRKIQSVNTVPGVLIDGTAAQVAVLDSQFTGGSSANAALVLGNSTQSQLFARNVSVSGYGASIRRDGYNVLAGPVGEWLSGNVFSLNASVPNRTMNLPVEEAPLVPWESNPANWANPDDYPGSNDAQKIQAALNSGKPAIYFPRYYWSDSTLVVPPSVRQIDFLTSNSWLKNGLTVNEASSVPLFIEHSTRKLRVRINAPRTLNSRYSSVSYEVNTTAPVVAHFQTGAVLAFSNRSNFCPPNAKIFARSINEESETETNFLVDGGTMWVLGYKTEGDLIAFEARNGAFLEVLGGYNNFAASADTGKPTILNNESNVSYIGTNYMSRNYQQAIWEIRNGVTSRFANANFPRRNAGQGSGNYFVPLYVGYDPAKVLQNFPVAHWAMNETSGTVARDSTSNGLNVTLTGSPTWTAGKVGGALNLNGTTQFGQVSDSSLLDSTNKLSISFWVRPSNLDSSNPRYIISKRANGNNANYSYALWFHTGNKLFVDFDGNGNRFRSNTAFANNTWYHIALTFDGTATSTSRVKLYINGVLDRTAAESSASIPNYTSSLWIGIANPGYPGQLGGLLDEIQIHRAVLSLSQIQALSGIVHPEVIVDNTDSSRVNILGSWTAATSAAGYIGENYLSDDNTGKGTKSVKYTPVIIAAANYNVYIRYTSGSNRATNVPIDIVHSGGTDLLSLDQRTRGGAWVLLGG